MLGSSGEAVAVSYLKKQGYRIIDTNFRTDSGEIDVVAERNDVLVFVEVKARTSSSAGYPEDAVTNAKIRKIESAVRVYLRYHGGVDRAYRIDIIAVEPIMGKLAVTRHIEGI